MLLLVLGFCLPVFNWIDLVVETFAPDTVLVLASSSIHVLDINSAFPTSTSFWWFCSFQAGGSNRFTPIYALSASATA
jgi:hypothetical protein